jgi:hypothetical protein
MSNCTRKNCDNCIKSNLRCSGRGISDSCLRCEEEDLECVFSLKKKTGPKVIIVFRQGLGEKSK